MTMGSVDLTCIRCPRGCQVSVTLEEGRIVRVSGNACPRGDEYARKEVCDPTRQVTSVVPVTGARDLAMLPVKCSGEVPKGRVMDVVRALRGVRVAAPVRIGDVIVRDVCGSGVDVVATRDCPA